MKLFDANIHDIHESINLDLPPFDFWNRRSSDDATNIRETWNHFFAEIPQQHQSELRSRLRSDFEHSIAACYEIFLHKFFNALSASLEFHPTPPCDKFSDVPEYLVEMDDNYQFVLEATCLFCDRKRAQSDLFKSKICSRINKEVFSDSIALIVRFHGSIKKEPNYRKIVSAVKSVVMSWERLVKSGVAPIPDHQRFVIENASMEIRPRKRTTLGAKTSMITLPSMGAFVDTTRESLRKKLRGKANKDYKNWGIPLVIAVNLINCTGIRDEEIIDSIFGNQIVRLHMDDREIVASEVLRDKEGFWMWKDSPINRRVHAVIITRNISFAELDGVPPTIWMNPFIETNSPLDQCEHLRRFIPDKSADAYCEIEGKPYTGLLGLWPGWPNLPSGGPPFKVGSSGFTK